MRRESVGDLQEDCLVKKTHIRVLCVNREGPPPPPSISVAQEAYITQTAHSFEWIQCNASSLLWWRCREIEHSLLQQIIVNHWDSLQQNTLLIVRGI